MHGDDLGVLADIAEVVGDAETQGDVEDSSN